MWFQFGFEFVSVVFVFDRVQELAGKAAGAKAAASGEAAGAKADASGEAAGARAAASGEAAGSGHAKASIITRRQALVS